MSGADGDDRDPRSQGMLFLASSARSRMTPVAWIPTVLPTKSAALATGFAFCEKTCPGGGFVRPRQKLK